MTSKEKSLEVFLYIFCIKAWNKRGISPAVQSPLAQNIPLFRLLVHCPLNSWWLRSSVSRIYLCLRRSSAKSVHGHCPIFAQSTKKQTRDWKTFAKAHSKKEKNKCVIYSDWFRRRGRRGFWTPKRPKNVFSRTQLLSWEICFQGTRNPNIS